MLPSAPLVITIVVGGAGFTKRSVTHSTASSRSTNGTSVSAASRHETPEMRKRGTNTMERCLPYQSSNQRPDFTLLEFLFLLVEHEKIAGRGGLMPYKRQA